MPLTLEVLIVIVIINALATISLWRAAARKTPRPKRKFVRDLTAAAITPKHKPPTIIGGQFAFMVSEEDRGFFRDFSDFADVVNWWFAEGPWRLQELSDTELRIGFRDSPDFGRCYDVFHGRVCLGRLEVSPGIYRGEKPEVWGSIELDMVRLLSLDDVVEFLWGIAMHVTDRTNSEEYVSAKQSIQDALTKTLWQSLRISEFYFQGAVDWGELALSLHGSPSWYFTRRDSQGFREMRERSTSGSSRAS